MQFQLKKATWWILLCVFAPVPRLHFILESMWQHSYFCKAAVDWRIQMCEFPSSDKRPVSFSQTQMDVTLSTILTPALLI